MMQVNMNRRDAQLAAALCKGIMLELRNFVVLGDPLSAANRAILIHRYGATVLKNAMLSTEATPIREKVVREIRDWIDVTIPQGQFVSESECDAWMAHQGLYGAPEAVRTWFRLTSDWWHPKRMPKMS